MLTLNKGIRRKNVFRKTWHSKKNKIHSNKILKIKKY